MKKCAKCGLLNDDPVEACEGCGFTLFDEKPAGRRSQEKPQTAPSVLSLERHGTMVTLKCRTPGEAYLVWQNLESAEVIALLPDEQEMLLQYRNKGYVELQIPADAYNSTGDLRSILEFSEARRAPDDTSAGGLLMHEKGLAVLLGFFLFPGIVIFPFLLAGYLKNGAQRKAKDLKHCFLLGVASLVLILLGIFNAWRAASAH